MKESTTDVNATQLAIRLSALHQVTGLSYQALAERHGVQRSNLSSFASSRGQTRNIALEKVGQVLYDLGLLATGVIRNGWHRWDAVDVTGDAEEIQNVLLSSLARSDAQRLMAFVTEDDERVFYLLADATGTVMMRFRHSAKVRVEQSMRRLGLNGEWFRLGVRAGAQLHQMWLIRDQQVAERAARSVLGSARKCERQSA